MRFGTRELLFVLVLAAMPLAAWFFVFKPTNQQIQQARMEIVAKQSRLRELEAATSRINDQPQEIDKLADAIKLAEAKLPAEKDVDVILKEVWQLAGKHGLKAKSVRPDKIDKTARYSEQPMKMVILGDFEGFYSFLLDLEKLKRITRIPDMTLTKLKSDKEGEMEASFTLKIFFEPQSAQTAAAGS
jgi:type IV pilus assembly protein PilO